MMDPDSPPAPAVTITDAELDDIYAFAIQLGKDAGKMLLDAAQSRFTTTTTTADASPNHHHQPLDLVEKESSVDIVTKTDKGSPSLSPPFHSTHHPPP